MAEEALPLLHYLKRPNPEVDSTWSLMDGRSENSKYNGKNSPHDALHLRNVFIWEGMEWEDLKPIFDSILECPASSMPNFEDFLRYPSHLKEVSDENSLDTLLTRWNYPVVAAALSKAQSHDDFRDKLGTSEHLHEISIARGGQAWLPNENMLKPDWAGILLSCHDNKRPNKVYNPKPYLNVLPGDTKLSTKFKSEWGWQDPRFKGPITQVFTYCRRARVPYGYIITQEELVILRLFYGDKENASKLTEGTQSFQYVEYKSIPWANNTNHELTINLTLWCLHMLAARRKPIGGRKELKSEYPTPEKSTQGRTTVSESSGVDHLDSTSVRDEIQHSFSTRRRSEDTGTTGSERGRGTMRKRRRRH